MLSSGIPTHLYLHGMHRSLWLSVYTMRKVLHNYSIPYEDMIDHYSYSILCYMASTISAAHDGKVGHNTVKYIIAFLYSDWLYFLWHGTNKNIFFLLVMSSDQQNIRFKGHKSSLVPGMPYLIPHFVSLGHSLGVASLSSNRTSRHTMTTPMPAGLHAHAQACFQTNIPNPKTLFKSSWKIGNK